MFKLRRFTLPLLAATILATAPLPLRAQNMFSENGSQQMGFGFDPMMMGGTPGPVVTEEQKAKFYADYQLNPHVLRVEHISVETAEKIAQQQLDTYYLIAGVTPQPTVTSRKQLIGNPRGEIVAAVEESVTSDPATQTLILNATKQTIGTIDRILSVVKEGTQQPTAGAVESPARLLVVLLESPGKVQSAVQASATSAQNDLMRVVIDQSRVNRKLAELPKDLVDSLLLPGQNPHVKLEGKYTPDQIVTAERFLKESERLVAARKRVLSGDKLTPEEINRLDNLDMKSPNPDWDDVQKAKELVSELMPAPETKNNKRTYTAEELVQEFKVTPEDLKLFNIQTAKEIGRAVVSVNTFDNSATQLGMADDGDSFDIRLQLKEVRTHSITTAFDLRGSRNHPGPNNSIRVQKLTLYTVVQLHEGKGTLLGLTDSNDAIMVIMTRLDGGQ